jgi:hypothetical protein
LHTLALALPCRLVSLALAPLAPLQGKRFRYLSSQHRLQPLLEFMAKALVSCCGAIPLRYTLVPFSPCLASCAARRLPVATSL